MIFCIHPSVPSCPAHGARVCVRRTGEKCCFDEAWTIPPDRTAPLRISPEGESCTLDACRPGFFLAREGGLCLKTEYCTDGHVEVYCSTGERFWGGTTTEQELKDMIVQPVRIGGATPA